jgi:hypothetical protein
MTPLVTVFMVVPESPAQVIIAARPAKVCWVDQNESSGCSDPAVSMGRGDN